MELNQRKISAPYHIKKSLKQTYKILEKLYKACLYISNRNSNPRLRPPISRTPLHEEEKKSTQKQDVTKEKEIYSFLFNGKIRRGITTKRLP